MLPSCRELPRPWCSQPEESPAQGLWRAQVPKAPGGRKPSAPLQCQVPTTAAAREYASSYSLEVRREVANVVGRQALGDGLHDAVRPGRPGTRRIIIQLFYDVAGLLAAQRRKFCRLVAFAGRTMAGPARGDAARLIAAAIQLFSRRPEGRIGFQPSVGQAVEIRAQIRHIV